MHIQKHASPPIPRTLKQPAPKPPQPDGFSPTPEGPREPRTSWFHRTTGAVAGALTLATVGTLLLGPAGNGRGAEGLLYPIAGMLVGGAVGLVAGAAGAGAFHSTQEKTSFYHRASGALSGAVLGGIAGLTLIGPMGNGMGGDGLVFAAAGLAGGALTGTALGTYLAGRFPDK